MRLTKVLDGIGMIAVGRLNTLPIQITGHKNRHRELTDVAYPDHTCVNNRHLPAFLRPNEKDYTYSRTLDIVSLFSRMLLHCTEGLLTINTN